MKREAVIVSACRTAIGSFGGSLSGVSASELGAAVIRESIRRAGIAPSMVDEVFMGCVIQAGLGQNVARQASVSAGIPYEVPATAVNMVCGSGLKAVCIAAQTIISGDNEAAVAGGLENMSQPASLKGSQMGDENGRYEVSGFNAQ